MQSTPHQERRQSRRLRSSPPSLNNNKNSSGKTNDLSKLSFLLNNPTAKFYDIIEQRNIIIHDEDDVNTNGKHSDILNITAMRDAQSSSYGGINILDKDAIHVAKQEAVLKLQPIQRDDISDPVYKELIILKQVGTLAKRNLSQNFVEVCDWFKSYGDYYESSSDEEEEEDDDEKENHSKNKNGDESEEEEEAPKVRRKKNTFINQKREERRNGQYMSLILEKADIDLHKFLTKRKNRVTFEEYRCIYFQLLYALHVAQREFEFVHNDLHAGNVLLRMLPPTVKGAVYSCDDRLYLIRERILVKLTDFGLSRVKLNNTELYSKLDHSPFSQSQDIVKFANALGQRMAITWPNPETKRRFHGIIRSFKKKIQSIEETPLSLMNHELFHELRFPNYDVNVLQKAPNIVCFGDKFVNAAAAKAYKDHLQTDSLKELLFPEVKQPTEDLPISSTSTVSDWSQSGSSSSSGLVVPESPFRDDDDEEDNDAANETGKHNHQASSSDGDSASKEQKQHQQQATIHTVTIQQKTQIIAIQLPPPPIDDSDDELEELDLNKSCDDDDDDDDDEMQHVYVLLSPVVSPVEELEKKQSEQITPTATSSSSSTSHAPPRMSSLLELVQSPPRVISNYVTPTTVTTTSSTTVSISSTLLTHRNHGVTSAVTTRSPSPAVKRKSNVPIINPNIKRRKPNTQEKGQEPIFANKDETPLRRRTM